MVVGLTGGIGSGKTTVANFFAEYGATVIDADLIAREVTEKGAVGYAAIVAHLGQPVLTKAGELDRKKLRSIIFKDKEVKEWLESLLQPLILQIMREKLKMVTSPYCVMVIPLLTETNFNVDFLDRICVVDTPENRRRQWASQRDQVSEENIELIISAQSTREKRLALADDIIANNRDLAFLKSQVKKLHHQYLQMACP